MATRRRISRDEILEGASNILDSGVFGDLTVDSLARALHMSKSTLYKHFASKEELIVALVDNLCKVAEANVEAADLSGAPVSAFHTLAQVYGQHAAKLPRAVVLQLSRLPEPCQDRLELTNSVVGKALKGILARGVEKGEFSAGAADLTPSVFLAGARAAMEASARGEVGLDRAGAVAAVYALLLPGLQGAKV
jgi:AcrR family transcriptional regulator